MGILGSEERQSTKRKGEDLNKNFYDKTDKGNMYKKGDTLYGKGEERKRRTWLEPMM